MLRVPPEILNTMWLFGSATYTFPSASATTPTRAPMKSAPSPSGALIAETSLGNTHVRPATVVIKPLPASALNVAEVACPKLTLGLAAVITRTSSAALEFEKCRVTVRRSADRMTVSVGLPKSTARPPGAYKVPAAPRTESLALSEGSRTIKPKTSVGKVTAPACNCATLPEAPTGSACR